VKLLRTKRTSLLLGLLAVLALTAAACGGGGEGAADQTETEATETETEATETETETEATETETGGGTAAALPSDTAGPACDQVPESGPGSAQSMSQNPVATAASNNPLLSTLVDAVMQAELASTLNSADALTVFAPANSAFEKIPSEQLNSLLNNKQQLATVLQYHVVMGEQLAAPDLVEMGEVDTLPENLDPVTASAEGDQLQLEAADGNTANAVCFNVATSNATVHIIDSVLMPGGLGSGGSGGSTETATESSS
jgi:uncharacterized surface protein with fasciclin (FAS1) repeats